MQKIFPWLLIIFLALCWYPLTNIYFPPNIHHEPPIWFAAITLIAAILSGILSGLEINLSASRRMILIFSLILVLFAILIPIPFNFSSIFILISTAFYYLLKKIDNKWIVRIATTFFIIGVIFLIQSAILPFFYLFASKFHKVEIFAPIISGLMNLTGSITSFSQGYIFIETIEKLYTLIPSWDALGHYPALNIIIGGYFLFYLFSAEKKYYFFLPLLIFIYFVIRYLAIIFICIEFEHANVFWRLDIITLSLLPLPFFITKFFTKIFYKNKPLLNLSMNHQHKLTIPISILTALCVLSFITFFGFVDPGEKKEGRVLIDEKHSDWEWTTLELDTKWYGQKSTYNYYSLSEYLKNFYQVDRKSEELTLELLKNYDILFIKTPTEAFTEKEIKAITLFVENCGGLLLVGDHTNVFGITTNLNPLATKFGFKYRYDGQYDLDGELSIYKKPKILPHPIVQNMPPFLFATGCMLDAPILSENAIIGYGIKSIYLDYARKNFFPENSRNTETIEFGLFVQAAGKSFGKGRIFLFTDSTVWSNFYMFIPGKPQLLLGIMEWLNRRNSIFSSVRIISLIVAFLCFIILLYVLSKTNRRNLIFILIFSGLLCTSLAISLLEKINNISYPLPVPHRDYLKVNFESEYSNFELPVLHATQSAKNSYHTFYMWLQRLGIVPELKSSLKEAFIDGDAVVIINPKKTFHKVDIGRINNFLESGGNLLIMDDPRFSEFVYAKQLLQNYGLVLDVTELSNQPVKIFSSVSDSISINNYYSGGIKGGNFLLNARVRIEKTEKSGLEMQTIYDNKDHNFPIYNEQIKHHINNFENSVNKPNQSLQQFFKSKTIEIDTTKSWPIMSYKKVGKGKIIILAASYLFTNQEMGHSNTLPDKNQKQIYDLEYYIFRDLFELKKAKSEK